MIVGVKTRSVFQLERKGKGRKRGREGRRGEQEEGKGREGRRGGEGREGKGREGKGREVTQLCLTLCDPMGSLSMGFSRQGYWSGLPFPSPEDLPNPEIEPGSPTLQADASLSEPLAITKWSHNLRQDIFRFLGLFSH